MLSFLFFMACSEKPTDTAETSTETSTEDTTPTVDDLSWVNPDDLPAGDNACREPIRVLVENVIDGDTFVGQGENGEERIRIIGVNTPGNLFWRLLCCRSQKFFDYANLWPPRLVDV